MFGTLGGPELFLILVVALIVFGPRKLPEMGRSLGRMMAEFRKASHDFQRTIEDEVDSESTKPPTPPGRLPAPDAVPPEAAPGATPSDAASAPKESVSRGDAAE
jgi:TatA/E family protein of Tat protein translocase